MIVSGDQRKDSATHPTLYPTSPKFPSPLSYTPYVLLSCWGLQAVLQTFLLFFDIIWFPKFVYFRIQEDEIALIWAPRISLFFLFLLVLFFLFFFFFFFLPTLCMLLTVCWGGVGSSDRGQHNMQSAFPKSCSLMRLFWHEKETSSVSEAISMMHMTIPKYFYRFTGGECGEGWELILWSTLKFGLNINGEALMTSHWSLLKLMDSVPL